METYFCDYYGEEYNSQEDGVFDGFMLILGLWLIVVAVNSIVHGKW